MRKTLIVQFLLCALIPFVLPSIDAAQTQQPGFAEPFIGRWDLTVQGLDGPYPSWLEVRLRKEIELMGSFVGRFGSMRHLTQIEYRNGELLFRVPVQYEQNKSDLVFKGRLTGDKLEGTTEDADGKTLKWSGTRAPDLRRVAPPKWGRPIQLFNGKDLSGWKLRGNDRGNCWNVTNRSLTNNVPCVDVITAREFKDFKLHVEFSIVDKSNSGIYLRGRYEVQIQDDWGKTSDSLRMGGLYGFLRPSVNASGRPGEWQTFDITLVGRRLTVVLNGKNIINNEEIPGITGGALNSDEGAPGPLMLQGDHTKVTFRNVTITPAQ